MLIEDLFQAPWHEQMNEVIKEMIDNVITDRDILTQEIQEWENSERRKNMITGEQYYLNKVAIREKKQKVEWKSNQQLSHGYTKKLVDQKIGYLLSKEPTFGTENEEYREVLKDIFHRGLLKKIKNVGKEAINKGIAYLHPYFNEEGELSFTKFPSEQIIPTWKDNEHLEIISFIRVYEVNVYMNGEKEKQKKVEYYHEKGITYYTYEAGNLILDIPAGADQNYHFQINDKGYVWERIPLIHFKYNEEEQPLIDNIKSLVDNYNLQASTNADLLADIPKFIYKLVNYGGTDLGKFLADLNEYMVVSLDANGDLDKLQADVQTDAVEKELKRIRDSLYEFGRGVDMKDDEIGNASGKAMAHRYGDLDMDCNVIESEFQSSIKHMLWFINHYLMYTNQGDYTKEEVNTIFNRDIIINETEAIENCVKSSTIIDDQTIRENHPWYSEKVEDRLKKQQEEDRQAHKEYEDTFRKSNSDVNVDE